MPDKSYVKVRMGKGRAFLARALPGGWFAVVATGSPENISQLWMELTHPLVVVPEVGTQTHEPNAAPRVVPLTPKD